MFTPVFNLLNKVPFVIWLIFFTFLLGYIAWKIWVRYIQSEFISGIQFILMEVIPPREVLRSPRAMELFFTNALYQYSKKGVPEAYWKGEVPLWFSLEIVSIEGQVHFYIRSPSRLKELIETQIYAQYPQAQVKIVEDYTLAVEKISESSEWNLWGYELKLQKPEAYPIKTYMDFGLDEDPKEEFKIDPISPTVELFGSIKKGEQMWLQIVITPAIKTYKHDKERLDWIEEGQRMIKKIIDPFTESVGGEEGAPFKMSRLPKWLEIAEEAINKKLSKLGFETGIRVCYVAKKEVFNTNSKKNIRMIFNQYANPHLNQFVRTHSTSIGKLFFTVNPKKVLTKSNEMLKHYRERAFFYHSHSHTFILNVEELATLFHFPGQVLKVPTLERIESKEASPPTNLPT